MCSMCSDDVYPSEDYLKEVDDDGQVSAICCGCADNVPGSRYSREEAEANGEEYEDEEDDYETMPEGWVGLDFGDD